MRKTIKILFLLIIISIVPGCTSKDIIVQYEELIDNLKNKDVLMEEIEYKVSIKNDDLKQDTEYKFNILANKEEGISEGSLRLMVNDDIKGFRIYEKGDTTLVKELESEEYIKFDSDNEFLNRFLRKTLNEIYPLVRDDEEIMEKILTREIVVNEEGDIELFIIIPKEKVIDIMEKMVLRNIGFSDIKKQTIEDIKKQVDKLNEELEIKITEEEIIKLVDKEMEEFEISLNKIIESLEYSNLRYEIVFNNENKELKESIKFEAFGDLKIHFDISSIIKGNINREVNIPVINDDDTITKEGINALINNP